MAHFRERHASELLNPLLKYSPLIGIFGHRQAGKTTFLERIVSAYETLDDQHTLKQAQQSPGILLKNITTRAGASQGPVGIDECQYAPALFPALKEFVRKNKKPGQIILSGSVRFYSRQAIRESLTGRIATIDLLPLVLSELCDVERAKLPLALINLQTFGQFHESNLSAAQLNSRTKHLTTYLTAGGLPGVCFLRNERIRSERIRDQLLLILDRDVRLIYPSSVPYIQLLDFVRQLSHQEGEPFQPTILRGLTGLAESTQKKLLYALESVFLVRLLSIEGDRKGVCLYFEDQAEQLFMHEEKPDPLKAFEGLVYRNLRASFFYEVGLDFRFFQFRARPDVRIPFAVKTKNGCLGVLPILGEAPTRRDLRMAHRFLQHYSPATILVVTREQAVTRILEPRILQIPAERLLFE